MNRVLIVALLLLSEQLFAQDVNILMKEASNLERSLKDEQALDKYKQVLVTEPSNIQALVRCSELSSAIGGRQKDKTARQGFYEQAKDYADKAVAVNAEDAD